MIEKRKLTFTSLRDLSLGILVKTNFDFGISTYMEPKNNVLDLYSGFDNQKQILSIFADKLRDLVDYTESTRIDSSSRLRIIEAIKTFRHYFTNANCPDSPWSAIYDEICRRSKKKSIKDCIVALRYT